MTSGKLGTLAAVCNKCGCTIPFAQPHLRITIMMNGPDVTPIHRHGQRYCWTCCQDSSMAVLFADVLNQPVQRIFVEKVWG